MISQLISSFNYLKSHKCAFIPSLTIFETTHMQIWRFLRTSSSSATTSAGPVTQVLSEGSLILRYTSTALCRDQIQYQTDNDPIQQDLGHLEQKCFVLYNAS